MLTQFAVVVTWGFVIASVIQAWRMYRFLPARIPVHFGFRGEPDGWGKRGMIWLLPIISVLMVAFVSAVPHLPSDKPAPVGLLAALNLEMAALYFTILQGQIEVALGRRQRGAGTLDHSAVGGPNTVAILVRTLRASLRVSFLAPNSQTES